MRLAELMRMPTGDKLSLRQWYVEAQAVMQWVRDEQLEVPPLVTQWLAGAEARAKDPVRAALENGELAKYLASLPRE